MEFLRTKFKKSQKPNEEKGTDSKEAPAVEESRNGNEDGLPKANAADSAGEMDEDDDDDFITNEVNRRLKELRNKSFMMLIPEESCPEDEEETSSSEWRELEADDNHPWFSFDSFYQKYCERMLFFDKMSARRLQEAASFVSLNTIEDIPNMHENGGDITDVYVYGLFTSGGAQESIPLRMSLPLGILSKVYKWSQSLQDNLHSVAIVAMLKKLSVVPGIPLNPSPRSASKKLALSLRSLSFKKRNDIQEDGEQLHSLQDDPYQDLETAYVAQICLSWEALHFQHMQLSHTITSQQENITSQLENVTLYSHASQQFQQFQVLLQRFTENEPFEQGHRVEIFARIRNSLPKLLQVPSFQGSDQRGQDKEDSETPISASDLSKEIENAIMTFRLFLKSDKKKSGSALNVFVGNNQAENSLQQIHASLNKKEMRLKELRRKKKGVKKKSWPTTPEQVEILFGLIDLKVVARVLRMAKISKEQLLWCEEKMSKIDASENRLQRDRSPVLFPC